MASGAAVAATATATDAGAALLVACDVALLFLLVAGLVANATVLLVFYRRPGLRTLSNRFVLNLVATNLSACCVFLPLAAADSVLSRPLWALCSAGRAAAAATCAASILGVLLIALDQYCAVVDPLHYHSRINKLRSAAMMLTAWSVALVFGALAGIVPVEDSTGSSLWQACLYRHARSAPNTNTNTTTDNTNTTSSISVEEPQLERADYSLYRETFAACYAIFIFAIPFAGIAWIYLCIYSAAHNNSKRTRLTGSGPVAASSQLTSQVSTADASVDAQVADCQPLASVAEEASCDLQPPQLQQQQQQPTTITFSVSAAPASEDNTALLQQVTVTVTPPSSPQKGAGPATCQSSPAPSTPLSRAASVRSTSSSIVTSLKHRISNASVFRYREETRAARVSALVVVMALFCWFPYVAALLLHSGLLVALPAGGVPHYVDALSLTMLAAGTVASPFLFALRSRRVQREVRRIFGLPRPSEAGSGTATCRRKAPTLRRPPSVQVHHPQQTHLTANYSHVSLDVMASLAEGETDSLSKDSSSSVLQSLLSKTKWGTKQPKCRTMLCDFVPVPDAALSVDTCRSSFSSGASTQYTSSTVDTGIDD
ncbi:tyramine receptor tyra-2 [Schistocerca cancellata]|uniref:tyramine receptor tyra-2 n=1 Tax=Schistocerca cancellata TaxID=274614 RepID=UPI002118548D|nr:tyramine receptor tyra-2 [Schistocerca cancellata]